jgi:hypothetical protein
MTWKICLASFAAAALVACGGKSDGGTSTPSALVLTAAPSGGVLANGINTVIIHVDGSTKGPIAVRTDRGSFLETGGLTASNNTTPFDVTLVTCDSQTVAGCSGNALVSAADQAGASNRIQVHFIQVEICSNGIDDDGDGKIDCADSACAPGPTTYCGSLGAPVKKVCTAGVGGAPSFCGCPSANPAECVDCAVPANAGQKCKTATSGVGSAAVYGTCATGACTCVATAGPELNCGDGLDNDCNGLIDCDDPGCQPVGNAPGRACNPARAGLACSAPAATGGTSTCTVCAPGGSFTNAQPVETKCADGIDNDCSGLADCLDPNCASLKLVCAANGERCTPDLQCRCPDTSGIETSCDDGLDNDCDAKIDCADTDCSGKPCGQNGRTCNAGLCTCPGGQAKETTCGDRLDNDCDGLFDCDDPDCQPTTPGGVDGKACSSAAGRVGEKCDSLGRCTCPGGQSSESTCDDHFDNDCDGLVDCADTDCLSRACGPNGLTCGSTGPTGCSCPGGTVEICNNGLDDNCDGKVDCDDAQCQGTPGKLCGTTGTPTASYRCAPLTVASTTWVCRDTSNYVITLTPGVTRLAANGTATTTVTATLQDTTKIPPAVSGATIDFGTTLGTFLGATTPGNVTAAVTGADGKATVSLMAASSTGTAVITGMYSYNAGANSVTGSTSVVLPQLSQITLANQQYAIMGALGSGFQESNELTFQLTDSTNQPYPAGLSATLTHTSVGGSFIGADISACDLVGSKVCTVTVPTNALGQVKVILHSGTQATVTSVSVQATGGGTLVSFNSGNIAIVGAKASGNEISINCTPKNIPALTDTDCTKSNYNYTDATITCTVSLADRFKNKLGVATLVEMRTEAGAAGLPTSTPPYNIASPPANLGKAVNTMTVTGYSLPADVEPFGLVPTDPGYERRLDHGWDGCGVKKHNPRDGLVTIIAAVSGEEGFVDGSNSCPSDGVYNQAGAYPGFPNCLGEYFIDLGEPFVDYNDNGVHDSNEPFIDVNGNKTYDGPNGAWDAKTIIWAETRVVYTGYTEAERQPDPVSGEVMDVASRFYGIGLPPAPSPPWAPSLKSPPWPTFPGFTVHSATTGTIPTPAVSDSIAVFFSDLNLNLPTSRTVYGTTVQAGAKITSTFGAYPPMPQADQLGMNYTTHFCDRQVPTNPTTQCFSSCQFAICYAVTNVSGFGYGTYGIVTVNPGGTADGDVCVYSSAALTTGSVVRTLTLPVCGTSN